MLRSVNAALNSHRSHYLNKITVTCKKCGNNVNSGIYLGGRNNKISNCLIECPYCMDMIPLDAETDNEGDLHIFAKTAYMVLNTATLPTWELENLKELIKIQRSQQHIEQKDEFIETLRQELPDVEDITDLLVPTNAGEFYSFLGFLLALVTFVILMRGSSKESSPTVINNFYNCKNPESEAYSAAYEQSGIKRKDQCPCGSGKKFKNCHGI